MRFFGKLINRFDCISGELTKHSNLKLFGLLLLIIRFANFLSLSMEREVIFTSKARITSLSL